jgi:hypothetical protein
MRITLIALLISLSFSQLALADVKDRVDTAYYTNKLMQSQGYAMKISATGKDKTTLYISYPYAEQNFVDGMAGEMLASSGYKDRGFKKIVIVNNYGKRWVFTVK